MVIGRRRGVGLGFLVAVAVLAASPSSSMARPVGVSVTQVQRPVNDELIVDTIESTLASAHAFQGTALQVLSSHGVVTLSGAVSTARQRTMAAVVARHVRGVRAVVNQIVVAG
jgi:osmotically-inducible protein OsmY